MDIFVSIHNVPGDTYEQKLQSLSQCNCCERHKQNKPTQYTEWTETPFNSTEHTDCVCDCRHIARFICRQFPAQYVKPQVRDQYNTFYCITNDNNQDLDSFAIESPPPVRKEKCITKEDIERMRANQGGGNQ